MRNNFSFFLMLSLCTCVFAQKYRIEQKTDRIGYRYETVSGDPSKVRIYTLKNGLRVFLCKSGDEPRVRTVVQVNAGAKHDPADNTGLAHYLEHLLFKGTDRIGTKNWGKEAPLLEKIADLYEAQKAEADPRKKKEIYRRIDTISQEASKWAIAGEYGKMIRSMGAVSDARTNFDRTWYSSDIPSHELKRWLTLERERFGRLVPRLFHTELETVYEEYAAGRNIFNEVMMEALFPTHPYGQQRIVGYSAHLKNPSIRSVHRYFDTYYVPDNMVMILVGDIDYEDTVRWVDQYFGDFLPKPPPSKKFPVEKPIMSPVVRRIYGINETVHIGYRFFKNGRDELLSYVMHWLLSRSAGLMELNLVKSQRLLNAQSLFEPFQDYSVHILGGSPKEGQTLDQVKDLLLNQIEMIKRGDFDASILESFHDEFERDVLEGFKNRHYLAELLADQSVQRGWPDYWKAVDKMSRVSKKELVKFANEFYRDNHVILYQMKDVLKSEQSALTPINTDTEASSEFFKAFQAITPSIGLPEYLDFSKEIHQDHVKGHSVEYIENKEDDFFKLSFIYDVGLDYIPLLYDIMYCLLYYSSDDKHTSEELQKIWVQMGVNIYFNVQEDRTVITIKGLKKNLVESLKKWAYFLKHMIPDEAAYQEYVKRLIKGRGENKPNDLVAGLNAYAAFGKYSRWRDKPSDQTLKSTPASEWLKRFKEVIDRKHRVFYYGNDLQGLKKALASYHDFGRQLPDLPKKEYPQPETTGRVYWTDQKERSNISLFFVRRLFKFDFQKQASLEVFSQYFQDMLFNEVREKRSLAYTFQSYYAGGDHADSWVDLRSYIDISPEKFSETLQVMQKLMASEPDSRKIFQTAKESVLKKIASQRITKDEIFWSHEKLKAQDIGFDPRKELYDQVDKMNLSDLKTFFNTYIRDKNYNLSVVGKKESFDFEQLKKIGTLKELTQEEIFNY